MKLSEARLIAEDFLGGIDQYCKRAIIAGSVRREKPEVKDIEIVAEPQLMMEVDLFGHITDVVSQLD